ncbi:MAG: sigma factor-like helix-turn-helix DNA-binding protein, partial [Candidatus Limnocylindria bacterium]
DDELGRPDGWLFVVAVRRWRRRRLRDAIFRPFTFLDHHAAAPVSDRIDLLNELRRLPLRQRQVIVARYIVGLPQEETASALGIARGTVAALTSQGLAQLRERMDLK